MAGEATQAEAGSTPATTAGEAETNVTETAPVSTTLPVEELRDSAGKVAGGVAGYMEEKEAALLKSKTPPPAQAAAEETTTTAEETATETTAAAEETTTAETATAETAAEETTTETEEKKGPDRIRIGALKDGHLVASATEIARAEGISFAEAFERVKPKPPKEETASTATETTAASTLRSRADVAAEIKAAKEERRAAAQAADALEQGAQTKLTDVQEKLETLSAELKTIEEAEQQSEFEKETTAQRQFSETVSESKGQAVKYWPDAGVDGSDFSKRMLELSDQYEADPRLAHHVYEADAPFFFAELVAKERGETPAHLKKKAPAPAAAAPAASTPATPPATKPAAVSQRAVVRPVQSAAAPASGAARTTQGAPKDGVDVDSIKSVADYERAKNLAMKDKKALVAAR